MECEVCGREIAGAPHRVIIEGAVMNVCAECVSLGREIPQMRREADDVVEFDLVDDYPEQIRRSREQRGLTQEILARQLSERVSVIQRLESGRLRPDERLIKKIERALGIAIVANEPER